VRLIRPIGAALLLLVSGAPLCAQADSQTLLPNWLDLGLEQRGRAEGYTGIHHETGADDAYYLNRVRFDVAVTPADWIRFAVQLQDSRAAGRRQPVPAKMRNPLDVHNAFVDLGPAGKNGWSLRVGRQELAYGDQRLVGPANWGNVGRVFDAARIGYQRKKVRVEAFASTLVINDDDRIDPFETAQQLHGVHVSISDGPAGGAAEPYFFRKRAKDQTGESGRAGWKNVYTGGLRYTGPLPNRFDYTGEVALQGGDVAGDALRAWAAAVTLGRVVKVGVPGARLSVEYDYASGDGDPENGRTGTFDQLYPTNHGKYGIADQMGWRNMHGIRGGASIQLRRRWSAQMDYHSFWLATRNDAMYRSNGAVVARNPDATSSHTHQELDIQTVVTPKTWLLLQFGYAHIFPGQFLKESTGGSPLSYAYASLALRI